MNGESHILSDSGGEMLGGLREPETVGWACEISTIHTFDMMKLW